MNSFSSDFVNLQSILDLYGVSVSNEKIRENDVSKSIANDERFIIPDISYHKITQYIITDGSLMFIDSSKLDLADDTKLEELNVESSTLIESSETSYLSTTNENGPYTLGAELTKTISQDNENTKTSKLIIYANSTFAEDMVTISNQNVTPFTIYSNKDLLLNTVAYLTQKDSSITIRKNTNSVTYTATKEQNTIILLIIFIIPLLIILVGIVVGFVRKRKK